MNFKLTKLTSRSCIRSDRSDQGKQIEKASAVVTANVTIGDKIYHGVSFCLNYRPLGRGTAWSDGCASLHVNLHDELLDTKPVGTIPSQTSETLATALLKEAFELFDPRIKIIFELVEDTLHLNVNDNYALTIRERSANLAFCLNLANP